MAKHKSAFPIVSDVLISYGLTKREYFAALAMQGELASQFSKSYSANQYDQGRADQLASLSVAFSDALIAELEKGDKNE